MTEFKNIVWSNVEFKAGDPAPFHPDIHKDSESRCCVCGRKTKENSLYMEVVDGGNIREQDGTEADIYDPGYMGCWSIGSECAKKFAPNILFKRGAS